MKQKRKPHSATTRKPPLNRPKPIKNEAEYSSVSGFLLTSRKLPINLIPIILQHWQNGVAIHLYPRTDSYSVGGRPLEFGAALGLLPLKGGGQIMAVRLYHEEPTVPVEIEELQLVSSFDEVELLWQQTFDLVWNAEPDTDTQEPAEALTLIAEESSQPESDTTPEQ